MPNNGISEYFASLRYIWRDQLLRACWRHNKTKRGITDTVTVYLFLAKIRCLNFQNEKNGMTLISQPDLRYISQFTMHSTKPRGGYRCTVYCHTSLWQKKSRFFICLAFRWRIFFLEVAKNVPYVFSSSSNKCTVAPKHRKATWPSNSTRDRPQQRAATKARSHQTDGRRLARS